MCAIMAGQDTLTVLPTGAGKSAIYQVPAPLLPGPTVVISPLLALQQDQIASLTARRQKSLVAVRLSSAEGKAERAEALQALRAGDAEFVFLTPEQFADPDRVAQIRALRPSLIVVDEAHCVSTWGHDFRPDYLQLKRVIRELGGPPVVALTATASPPVRQDIVARLGLRKPVVIVGELDRPNLFLESVQCPDEDTAGAGWSPASRSPSRPASSTRRPAARPRSWPRGWGRSPTTAGWAPASASGCTRTSTPTGCRCWSPRPRSAWASTSRTSAGSTTWACPTRRTATCRRSAGPGATASPRRCCCCTAPRTAACASSSARCRSTPRRSPSWPHCCASSPSRSRRDELAGEDRPVRAAA